MEIKANTECGRRYFIATNKHTEKMALRLPLAYKYAITKGRHEKRLSSNSEVVEMCCKGEYNLNKIIDRFTQDDWDAIILDGRSEYDPNYKSPRKGDVK